MTPWTELTAEQKQRWCCELLGWTELHVESDDGACCLCGREPGGIHNRSVAPDPLHDANDTLKVVDAMRELGWDFYCGRERVGSFQVKFADYVHRTGYAAGGLFPLAVCEAAYDAIGGET